MRKIEVAVPKGKGKWVAFRAEKAGASDVIILESHGPGINRELVSITAKESAVDAIIKSISEYEDKKHIQPDIRIWKAEEPFAQVEKEGKEERRVPVEELKAHAYESSSIDMTYIILCVLSGLLAAFGLLQDSPIVVIGAMIIAPLLRPITTSSLGTVTGDVLMFWRGASALTIGLLLSCIVVFFSMFLLPASQPSPILLGISQLSLLTIGVAFISGIIAAVSLLTDLNEALAGVAIAVSLMPPVAALSINVFFAFFGIVDFTVAATTLLVLLVNIISIDIGSAVVFYAYGVAPKKQEKKFFSTHLKVAALMLFMLSIPFVYTSLISYEQSQIETIITATVAAEAASVGGEVEQLDIRYSPLRVDLKIVSFITPPEGFRDRLKQRIERDLSQEVSLKLFYVKAEPI
ncbi:MAG: TIGR00341 family protein [Candidatus Diapherotrites archaeon]|nr:TIGR00341 family protein [Candidatus Diapherotrites archaeon]